MKKVLIAMVALVGVMMLSGCANQYSFAEAEQVVSVGGSVGFWHGLWHGMVLPISWIGSLLDDNIAIYCIANNGGWYNFGFALGAGAILTGGISSGRD